MSVWSSVGVEGLRYGARGYTNVSLFSLLCLQGWKGWCPFHVINLHQPFRGWEIVICWCLRNPIVGECVTYVVLIALVVPGLRSFLRSAGWPSPPQYVSHCKAWTGVGQPQAQLSPSPVRAARRESPEFSQQACSQAWWLCSEAGAASSQVGFLRSPAEAPALHVCPQSWPLHAFGCCPLA